MRRLTRSALLASVLSALPSLAQAQQLVYTSINPCRIVDTRPTGAGALVPGAVRTFHVVGAASDFTAQGGAAGGCGIPGFAGNVPQTTAVVFNFVAVNPAGPGNLRAWATDQAVPNSSIINYTQVTGLNLANAIIVPVRQDSEGNDLSVRADVSGTHVVVDVVGYFTPLRIVDNDLPVVPIAKGGTGATVQTFVDLSNDQMIAGAKTFGGAVQAAAGLSASTATVTGTITADAASVTNAVTAGSASITGTLTTGSPALVPVVGQDANQRIVRGAVLGATCTIQGGSGFTCVRNGVGNYTLTLNPAFSGAPLPMVTPLFGALVNSLSAGATSVQLTTINTAGAPVDAIFAFMLIGPR
jgi:hypothetical protein